MSNEVNRRQAQREHLHRRADNQVERVERPDLPHAPFDRALAPGKQTLIEPTQVRAETPGKQTLVEAESMAPLAAGRPGAPTLTEALTEPSAGMSTFETHVADARESIVALADANASRDVLRSSGAAGRLRRALDAAARMLRVGEERTDEAIAAHRAVLADLEAAATPVFENAFRPSAAAYEEFRTTRTLGQWEADVRTWRGGEAEGAMSGTSTDTTVPRVASAPPTQTTPSSMASDREDKDDPKRIAARGFEGVGGRLPFFDRIQASFGRHDVSRVRAHVGGAAARAARQLGARAFAFGDRIAFDGVPDLHTAAHEAAHHVQQRAGVALKGDIDQSGDEYEQHADAVADAVVRGDSAEPLLDRMAGRGASASPASPRVVQRKTGSQTLTRIAGVRPRAPAAPPFVNEHRGEILRAIATRITETGVPAPHARIPWADRDAGARALAQAIRGYVEVVPDQSLKRLMMLSYPADLLVIATDALHGAGGVKMVALMIATAFDVPLRSALLEMGMRLRVYLDEHGAKPDHASWLVASNPLHGLVAEVLLQRGLVVMNPVRSPSGDTPGKPFARGVREVNYQWMGKHDRNLWNWIRVTSPTHATVEDVAHTPLAGGEVSDGSEQAYRIAASPPYFGIPFETAKLVKEAFDYAPDEVKAQLATGPGPRLADPSALSKSASSDEAALAQARSPKKSDPPAERTLSRCEIQLRFLRERLAPWKAAGPLEGATAFIARRTAELARDPRSGTRWQGALAAQERVLHAVASELAEVIDDIGKKAKPAEARKIPAIIQMIEGYARAAGASHLGAQAGAALAAARQQRQLLPLALAEGTLRVARQEVAALEVAEQDAGFKDDGSEATMDALPALVTRAADLRLAVASGKTIDPSATDLLAVDADEAVLRARIQTIQTRVRHVDRLADEVGLSKERFEGGLPTMRAVADELLYRQIPHWKQTLDDGAQWKGPDEGKSREQTIVAHRRRAVTNVEHLLTSFDKVVDIGAYLKWAHARVNDEQLKNAIVDLALQFGIMFVTGQVAGAAVAAMRTIALGANIATELRNASFAMKAAEIAIHAGLDTVGQGVLGGPVDGKAFAENALGIIVSSAAMKPFQGIFHDSGRLEREVEQELKTWTQLAKRAGKLGAELSIDVGVSVASTHVVGAMMHGGELSMASSDELISQGLAIATSKFVGQRVEAMRQRMSQVRQERGLRELDKLLTRVDTLGKRARTGHGVTPDEALSMLCERHAILQAELKVYRRLATNPDTKTHATEALSKAKADANLGEGFIDATLRLAKLSPIVDGERYEGTPKQIKDALAAVQATGSVTHSYDKKSGVLRVRVGDKTIEITESRGRRQQRAKAPLPDEARAWADALAVSNPNKMTPEAARADLEAFQSRRAQVKSMYDRVMRGEAEPPSGVSRERLRLAVEGDPRTGERVPLNYESPDQFHQFQAELKAVFSSEGITDATVVQLGSGTTGWSSAPGKTGKPWSPKSDVDFAVFSNQALAQAMAVDAPINPKNQQNGLYTTLKNSPGGKQGFYDTSLGKKLEALGARWNQIVYGDPNAEGFDFKLNLSDKPFGSAVPILVGNKK